MIKIEHRSKLQGAERFGSCASCGKERDVYKITFEERYNRTSISLCFDCMNELRNQIVNEKEFISKQEKRCQVCIFAVEDYVEDTNNTILIRTCEKSGMPIDDDDCCDDFKSFGDD